ncbi:MAG: dephospho-CoA kinase [Gammaproteobacteria bacterium]
MYVVGLTGGIGSGKTAASDRFQELGIKVVDADVAARVVVEPKRPALKKIEEKFGSSLILGDGSLNRSDLREIIFKNEDSKIWLESLLHPLIAEHILDEIKNSRSAYSILVSPLLFETTQHQMCNRNLLIDVSIETQISRTTARDRVPEEQVKKIISSQMTREDKLAKTDDVIINEGDLNDLIKEVDSMHEKYIQLSNE